MRILGSALLGAALALSGAAFAQEKYSLSIATGGTGGVYYPIGGGMANILSKYVPGMQATAEVTGGSVDNLKLIAWNTTVTQNAATPADNLGLRTGYTPGATFGPATGNTVTNLYNTAINAYSTSSRPSLCSIGSSLQWPVLQQSVLHEVRLLRK